jgi:hypothetical protein
VLAFLGDLADGGAKDCMEEPSARFCRGP